MANPQIENGYIRISNELYRAMYQTDMSAAELRILHFIVYQTYGYNKKARRLSKSYIVNGTGLSIDAVKRNLKRLIDNNIIIAKSEQSNEAKILSVNKNFDKWRGCKNAPAKMPLQKHTYRGGKNAPSEGAEMHPKTIQNKTIQNKTRQSSSRQQPPTLDEVLAYVSQRGYTFSAEKFFLSHEATGWIANNGKPIENWKALCDIWQMNERQTESKPVKTIFGKEVKEDKWQ